MEGDRFDALTKTLTTTARSRRQTLAGLALGALSLLGGEAEAKRHRHRRGHHGKGSGSTQAKPPTDKPGKPPTSPPSGRCQPGFSNCRGQCVDVSQDRNNCGACATVCPERQSCCPTSSGGGQCVDTQTSTANCGGCGAACPAGLTCCGGRCVNSQTDDANCGGCGTVCLSDRVCQQGSCVCRPGLSDCSGACVNTNLDPENCGACTTVCNGGCSGITPYNVCEQFIDGSFCSCTSGCFDTDQVCGNTCWPRTLLCGDCSHCPGNHPACRNVNGTPRCCTTTTSSDCVNPVAVS
jgi:hypothetical protein